MSWKVYRNGKWLGIVETNFTWAVRYWASRNTEEQRFTLRK